MIFTQENIPIFQNKVYASEGEAMNAKRGDVELVQSELGFAYNKSFNPTLMVYDKDYQNEQGNSLVFREHLRDVICLLKQFGVDDKRIVEIGCGKGFFFEMMVEAGFNCWGFDPVYEGNNKRIIKKYFDSVLYSIIDADVIILRHTLEHVEYPFAFLHTLARNYKGYIFIEVPTFDWIIKNNAFWDIFYEHCNYFTEDTLSSMFEKSKTGTLFGGQYIYLWADLSSLNFIPKKTFKPYKVSFDDKINGIKVAIHNRKIVQSNGELAIWGAGAKGSTFLNLIDPKREYIKYAIDINPAKQNKYIAGTGHKIISPDNISVDGIIVMNNNYMPEISSMVSVSLYNL